MSDLEIKPIKRQISIPKVRLWLIWFILVVFPTFAGLFTYIAFCKEYSYFFRTELISKGYETIENYNQNIAPEKFMSNQLPNLQLINSNLSSELLKSEIDRQLCGETMFCMFFDDKAEKITTVKGLKATKEGLRIPPLALIKKHLKNLVSGYSAVPNDPQKQIKITSYQRSFGPVLQQLYKTATSITITPNRISKNFSVKLGGELYFGFGFFKKPQGSNYGFFFVMRGCDFKFRDMLNKLHNQYPDIKIIFREMDIQQIYQKPEIFYSGIQKDKDKISIIAPAPMSFSRHVLHGGTENFNEKFNKLLPFIEYMVPLDQHALEETKTYNFLRLLALLIIIITGIYCLHINLFGFDQRLIFKHKILLLALIASLFPFSLFCISVYAINHYNRFINELSIKQHAATELQRYNLQLEQSITKLEANLSETIDGLTIILNNSPVSEATIKNYFIEASKTIPATSFTLLLKKSPEELKNNLIENRLIVSFPERLSNELIDESSDATFNLLPEYALQTINDNEEIIRDREQRDRIFLLGKEINVRGINHFLENDGKLTTLSNGNVPLWFSSLQILDTSNQQRDVIALLVSKFEPRPLISSFMKNSYICKNNFKESFGNYEINYAFLPVPNSGSAECWSGSGNISKEDEKLCLSKPVNEKLNLNTDSCYKQIIKNLNQLVPHLAVAIITEKESYQEYRILAYTVLSVVIFLALILFLTSKLIDLMFGEPVNALAASAIAIAQGSEDWKAEIRSGDEFEDLNNDFKHLVTSLRERNLLKSYLSEDAFSDIEENNSLKLSPGGEYKEATIVFSAIKNYQQLIADMSPDEVIILLSKYVSVAEEVTKKYGGSLDKIIGDTIMLVFRDDPSKESHGLRAAKAALEFVEKIKASGFPGLYTGIASGTVISGKIGSYSGKLDFTVIGNPVNLAARFKSESKNGTGSTGIIISGITMRHMNGRGRVKFLRRVSIKGKARKYNIYELEGLRE